MSGRDWTHPYYFLKNVAKPILGNAGYSEISEELCPDVFGSAYSVFSLGSKKIRIIWDGKDGWGYAQVQDETGFDSEWKDIQIFLTEGDIESLPTNDAKIEAFRLALSAIVVD